MFDAKKIRQDFPILSRKINNKPIVYLDSTATALKPQSVIDAEGRYYSRYSANVFRGIYVISEEATAAYEEARDNVARFIRAKNSSEVVFTRGTTESINLIMYGLSRTSLRGSELVATIMEHHSNFVPWQQLAQGFEIPFKVWDIDRNGCLDLKKLESLITPKTKVLAVTAVSNVLGTINPIKEITKRVKKINPHCLVVVDAAQAVPHMEVNVKDWGADFVAFSGHKMLGPTGIGVLWGRYELLEKMKPYHYGGEMISEVHVDRSFYKDPPHKFEAGTPHIAGAIGLGAAVSYLTKLGMENVRKHEQEITRYALQKLSMVNIIGLKDIKNRSGVIAFTMNGAHAHDIAQVLDSDNICIRAGHHCAMPLHEYLHLGATARASFYVYTTKEDIDMLAAGLLKVQKLFS